MQVGTEVGAGVSSAADKVTAAESKLAGLLLLNQTGTEVTGAKGVFPASKSEVYELEKQIIELQKEITMLSPVRAHHPASNA